MTYFKAIFNEIYWSNLYACETTHTTVIASLTDLFCRLGYGDLYAVQVVSHKAMKSTVPHGLVILVTGT